MKTAGSILRETRLKKGLSLEQIAAQTKIRPLYLQALEADQYAKLPSLPSARGFAKNYAELLGLPSRPIIALLKRDFVEQKSAGSPLGPCQPIDRSGHFWTPRTTAIVSLLIAGLLFGLYLFWQYSFLARAPYR